MTRDEAYTIITDYFTAQQAIIDAYELDTSKTFDDQFSVVSVERIMFNAVAECFATLGAEQTQFLTDVDELLAANLAHRPQWYAEKAKLLQYGAELVSDTDGYDNSGLTSDQVTAMQVVKYAAAVETTDKSMMFLKVATGEAGNRSPLSEMQLSAFKQYMNRISDSGVRITIINQTADEMRLEIDIYYNPLILDSSGKRLDGNSDTPVQDVIRDYLDNLEFNGRYKNVKLIDLLQAVDGVEIPELKSAMTRRSPYTEWTAISALATAYAGYYTITDENLTLNFIAYS